MIRRSTRVDFPAPGGPVTPMRRALPSERWTPASNRSNPGRPFSTTEIARASAAVLPAARSASRRSGSMAVRSPRARGEASGSVMSGGHRLHPQAGRFQGLVHVAEEVLLADLVEQSRPPQGDQRLGMDVAQEDLGALLPGP